MDAFIQRKSLFFMMDVTQFPWDQVAFTSIGEAISRLFKR